MAAYSRAWEEASNDGLFRQRLDDFERNFVVPAGGVLGGVSIWAIHTLLRHSQPALIGLFSPEARLSGGRCDAQPPA